MKDFVVSRLIKKLVVRFSGEQIILPHDLQERIDTYWGELLLSGKSYKRGEVFTVTKKEILEDRIEILVEKTDYAHYLYSQNIGNLDTYTVHIIHTASLVETSDGKIIFGEMGKQTSRSGIYQLCGGGIDNDDLRAGTFDFEHNIKKELTEELGIDTEDMQRIKSFELAYFKEGGPTDKMTVIYRVVLNETSIEFMKRYEDFALQLEKDGKKPEFGEITVLDKNKESFVRFLNQSDIKLDEYMKPLFEFIAKNF